MCCSWIYFIFFRLFLPLAGTWQCALFCILVNQRLTGLLCDPIILFKLRFGASRDKTSFAEFDIAWVLNRRLIF